MNTLAESSLSLELSRRFDAPPERVFDAWLGKEWGEWLPPRAARCSVTRIEPRVGGRYHLTMTMADGRNIEISGQYRQVLRPTKLVFTWFAHYNDQETLITLDFRRDGNGTLMTFRQDGFRDAQLRDGYGGGWNGPSGSFDKLDAALARDPAAAPHGQGANARD
jgi:uncharacterized protein YndB with AHSA1/START domain